MWPEPQKNGKVKFVERYINPLTGKTGKVSVTMEKDTSRIRKQAAGILDQRINDTMQKSSSKSASKKYTVQDLADAYCADQRKTLKASTCRRNSFTAAFMCGLLGKDTLLDKLTAPYIREKIYALDAPNASINERLKRMKGILRWGYNNDYMGNIAFLDKIQPLPDTTYRKKIADKYLERTEFVELVNGMELEHWRLFTKFLGMSGLRVGEAIALTKEDVDFKERLIRITKTYDSNNNVTTPAKTLASHRDVYMQDELYDVCRSIKSCMLKQGLLNGYGNSPLFFQNDSGGHISYYAYNKYVKENATRILGREKVTPHIFRHTHTCMLAENGVQLDTITRRLGHEDSSITKAVYLHITKRIKQNDYDQVAKLKIM